MDLYVDQDGGADDALALAVLAGAEHVVLSGVCGTAGNVSARQAAANAGVVVDAGVRRAVGRGEVVRQGSPHGPFGIGRAAPAVGCGRSVDLLDGVQELQAAALAGDHLLVLGPACTVAAAERQAPGALTGFASITVSGGLGLDPMTHRGQWPWAVDANTLHCPTCAEVLAGSSASVMWVGLDVTAPLYLAREEVRGGLIPLVEDYGASGRRRHGRWAVGVHDAVAAIVAAQMSAVEVADSVRMGIGENGMVPVGRGVDSVVTAVPDALPTIRIAVRGRDAD